MAHFATAEEGDTVLVYPDALTAVLYPDASLYKSKVVRMQKRSLELEDGSKWTVSSGRPWGADSTDLTIAFLEKDLPERAGTPAANVVSAVLRYCPGEGAADRGALIGMVEQHDDQLEPRS